MIDEQLLESLMRQVWAIYRSGGDPDPGASVAAQMHEVCDRLPVPVAHAANTEAHIIKQARSRRWRPAHRGCQHRSEPSIGPVSLR
jgi:hypothetical protein